MTPEQEREAFASFLRNRDIYLSTHDQLELCWQAALEWERSQQQNKLQIIHKIIHDTHEGRRAAIEVDRKRRGEEVAYVMSEDEVYEVLYDVAVSHIDSNGISVIEPDILDPLIRVLAVAVTDEAGFSQQPPQIQEGWQLVPKEPTYEMIEAADRTFVATGHVATWKYKAMLAAAPKPEEAP